AAAMAEGIGRLISMLLRLPSDLEPSERMKEASGQLRNIGGSRVVGFGTEQVRSLPDAVALALEKHLGLNGTGNGHHGEPGIPTQDFRQPGLPLIAGAAETTTSPAITGDMCPACKNQTLVRIEGCRKCVSPFCPEAYSEC